MPLNKSRTTSAWGVFVLVVLLGTGWALATNHVWEDYYITFRSSKNLATGQGLVFNPGERLHTFTSPLGVLLPAAASWLTGTRSDAAAIWVFRCWSIVALAGAAVLLLRAARELGFGRWAAVTLVALFALDAKTVDFATNGMETGLLLLFVAWTMCELFADPSRRSDWRLGAAWAGLMWTRPDCFLIIGLLAAGCLLFPLRGTDGWSRAAEMRRLIRAGVVCAALYLPWLLWSWHYYGSPVPHTIIAKGSLTSEPKTFFGVMRTLVTFPWQVWKGTTSLESTFLPSYYQIGGWPVAVVQVARALALALAAQWLWPRWRPQVRIASFVFCGLHVYLSYFPFFPFPWYLPAPNAFAALTLAGILAQLTAARGTDQKSAAHVWVRRGAVALSAVLLIGQGWLSWQMMRQMRTEQTLSADSVRKQTGLWLKEHARPGDTVFMEPLGHIAFFSGLKTFDFPGLSSREVVRAAKAVSYDWARLIEYLSPDWLVLRPGEINLVRQSIPRVVNETYQYATQFNTLDEVAKAPIYGRPYVAHDAHWVVFRRVLPKRYRVDLNDPAVRAQYPLKSEFFQSGLESFQLHAAGLISFKVPPKARRLQIGYGLSPGTYNATPVTDGADFVVWLFDGRTSRQLLFQHLDPAKVTADRPLHTLDVPLPADGGDERDVILETRSGATDAMDWCCWTRPQFLP